MKPFFMCSDTALTFSAPEAGQTNVRKFKQLAYSGEAMDMAFGRVAIELSGIKMKSQRMAMLRDHDPAQIVGFSESIKCGPKSVDITGCICTDTAAGAEIAKLADAGFPWQASIHCTPLQMVDVRAGDTVKCNGKEMNGPLTVVKKCMLKESSFVPLGADSNTSSEVIAAAMKGENDMEGDTPATGNIIKLSDALTVGEVLTHAPKLYEHIKCEALREDRERMANVSNAIKASALAESVQAALMQSCAAKSVVEAQSEIARVATIEASLTGCKAAGMSDAHVALLRADVAALTPAFAQAQIKAAADAHAKIGLRTAVPQDEVLIKAAAPENVVDPILVRAAPLVVEARAAFKKITARIPEAEYVRNYVRVSTASSKEPEIKLTDAQLGVLVK